MLHLSDPRWRGLLGAFGVAYDPRPALLQLERGEEVEEAWAELWADLYHDGDVGTASYAAVPHLVRVHAHRDVADWNAFALAGRIELRRGADDNPELPEWLVEGYARAWAALPDLALRELQRATEERSTRAAMGVLAIARGQPATGALLLLRTEQEIAALVPQDRR
jgi:hypothetical protein